jgi:transposase
MNPIYTSVAGLDVHKKIIVATILKAEEDGSMKEESREFSTLPDSLNEMVLWLQSYQVELTVMESTGVYWKNVYVILEKNNLHSQVVNAWHAKQVPGRKTDLKDSQWLAQLARFGLLKGSFIPEQQLQELRLLTRYRFKLQKNIASESNRMHKILDDAGVRLGIVLSSLKGVNAQMILNQFIDGVDVETILSQIKGSVKKKINELRQLLNIPLSDTHKFLLKEIRKHIDYMECQRGMLDQKIYQAMASYQIYWEILQTLPGMDLWSAAAFIAECGVNMEAFGSSDKFCSWAGMTPGNNESAGKRKSGKTPKGNSFVRTLLCEVSNAAIKTKSQFKEKYKTLTIRRGHRRSVVAIGHKMLRIIYYLFTEKKGYRDPGIDYQGLVVERNASRWLRALHKYGYT